MTSDRIPEISSYGATLTQVLTVTGVVVIGLVLIAKLLMRWRNGWRPMAGFTDPSAGRLEVIARLPLRPRTSLFVVRWDDREILVASSDSGVRELSMLERAPESQQAS